MNSNWDAFFDGSFNLSPFIPPSEPEPSSPQRHWETNYHPVNQRSYPPVRLPSPRLFRDIFSNFNGSGSDFGHPRGRPTEGNNMPDIIRNASQALQNAEEAFRTPSGNNMSEVVDLTQSPPERSQESRFISSTTHPHDNPGNRRNHHFLNSLAEPIYGASTPNSHPGTETRTAPLPFPVINFSPEPINDPSDSLTRLRQSRANAFFNRTLPTPLHPPIPIAFFAQDNTRIQEEAAIARQNQARRQWEETQRRRNVNNSDISNSSTMEPLRLPRQNSFNSFPPLRMETTSRPHNSRSNSSPESIDLTTVHDQTSLQAALSKRQQDAIASQKSIESFSESGRSPLTAYKCPICMEPPQNATSTVCGHLFCHKCIMETLKWSEDVRREEATHRRKVKGVCPVCRKELLRNDQGNKRQLIPLELKLMVKKRKRDDKGKGVAKVEVLDLSSDNEIEAGILGNGSEKENSRKGKSRKRESTNTDGEDEAFWGEFMAV